MDVAVNISEEKKEYVKNLILYINDIKPFHTKLRNVSEDVVCNEEAELRVTYTITVSE